MAKAPATPRRKPTRRRERTAPAAAASPTIVETPTKSTAGKVGGLVTGALALGTTLVGLHGLPGEAPPIVCGGEERWPVKVGSDKDATGGKIDLNAASFTVPDINQKVTPGLLDAFGRMDAEKKEYTVHGYLAYFRQEKKGSKGDRDYHVVIADDPASFSKTGWKDGRTVVVEFPDPHCFGGSHPSGLPPPPLGPDIAAARAKFEEQVDRLGLDQDEPIKQKIPVTVTGVGFFDRFTKNSHEPTGHATVQTFGGKSYVLELHPVTAVIFDNEPDPEPD